MGTLQDAAERLSSMDMSTELGEKFSGIDSIEKDSTVREQELVKAIERREPGKVAGVDGGLLKKRYAMGDVVAARAVAALFSFPGTEVEYLPSKQPDPDFQVFNSGDSRGLEKRAEKERLVEETSAALDAMETADTVLMDGSIVPRSLENRDVLENYQRLFDLASDKSLVGVVEDSHGTRLAGLLQEKLDIEVPDFRDTILMDAILESGERSFVRRYSDSPVEHPVLKKLDQRHANRIQTFYVKLSSHDLPLRIDYYGSVDKAERIAGELLSLKSSDRYTVPSPIVEADKRAKIPEKYLKRLEKRFSPGMRRRDRRAF